jgi:hypothetical protein
LRAALEALPTYIAKPMASVSWQHSRVTIAWSERQESLLSGRDESELQLHPELVRNIFQNMEASQKQLEEMKRELIAKEKEIGKLRKELVEPRASLSESIQVPRSDSETFLPATLHDLYRLGDYIARGQQLITLLVAQGRQTPQVQEAMRRVDWEFVSAEGPRVVQKIVADLHSMSGNDTMSDLIPTIESTIHSTENSIELSAASSDATASKRPKSSSGASKPPQKSFDGIRRQI